ncbi:MAG: asparagine synthase (glutamine-hydrolyzing) [Clostridia bacterium]|nr:asparagine synthase (glutamine-hydrolyzing) [Clostridia bacterium]
MCSICFMADFKFNDNLNPGILTVMGKTMRHRGVDESGVFLSKNVLMHHNRMHVSDTSCQKQPLTVIFNQKKYTVVCDGEIYNSNELKCELEQNGAVFTVGCDAEVLLWSYIIWKENCTEHLNGIYSFAIYDEEEGVVFVARDRFGVKPFFYAFVGSTLIAASEIKAILAHPGIKPKVDKTGLWQLLFLSPVTLNSVTVFRDIYELAPGEKATFSRNGLKIEKYWKLEAKPFSDSKEAAFFKINKLLCDSVKQKMQSNAPGCIFFSDNCASATIAAITAKNQREKGEKIDTYSFEFESNHDGFYGNLTNFLGTNHTSVALSPEEVTQCICDSVIACDYPGHTAFDSSLLHYTRVVKKHHTTALCGTGCDEIFGINPNVCNQDDIKTEFFPWVPSPFAKPKLFKENISSPNDGFNYLFEKLNNEKKNYSFLEDDSVEMKNSRIFTNVSVNYLLKSLLETQNRMSMASGISLRFPFADYSLAEYVYNVSPDIKHDSVTENSLLKNAMKDYLPEYALNRSKSFDEKNIVGGEYEKAVTELLKKELSKKGTLFYEIADRDKINSMFISGKENGFGVFGAKINLITWLVQFAYWLEKYEIVLI